MTKRRQRSDSVAAAVGQFKAAALPELLPPDHISVPDGAKPFWFAIIRARARGEWEAAPSLLNAAANLAWTQWQIDQARRQIDGSVAMDEEMSAAQLGSLLLKMQRLEMGYLRTLQQHGRAVEGEARDIAKRRAANQTVAATVAEVADDELLAQPTIQ
jgi:hypothetical protein